MKTIFLIAKRFLIPRNVVEGGIINLISFLGLFIGAASIILSIAVLNGFQSILQDETRKIYGDYALVEFDYIKDRELISSFENNNIKYAPFYEEEFFVSKNNRIMYKRKLIVLISLIGIGIGTYFMFNF